MVKKVDGGTPPDRLPDSQPPISPPKPESPRSLDAFVDCTGKPRTVDCKPIPTTRFAARTIAPEEVREVLKGIDEKIKEIDRLIPQFEKRPAKRDVATLKKLRQEFQNHRTKIDTTTDPLEKTRAAHSYTESSFLLVKELGEIRAKIGWKSLFR